MAEKITYYAMLLGSRTMANPSGLARRRLFDDGGVRDEALSSDFIWVHNPGLAGWERGDLTTTYVEVSTDEAGRIIERFRAKRESEDQDS
jgi:hypothetical protein